MQNTEAARAFFSRDTFATETAGIVIVEAKPGYAKCQMAVTDAHLNAAGTVMGGAIFTLADFTFAVAANDETGATVSLSATIEYLRPGRGPVLYAETSCDGSTRSVAFYTVLVTDCEGHTVAKLMGTGFCKQKS